MLSLCFGLKPADYVFIYPFLLLVTVSIYAVNNRSETKKGLAAVRKGLASMCGAVQAATSGFVLQALDPSGDLTKIDAKKRALLKDCDLENADEADGGLVPLRLDFKAMEQACQAAGVDGRVLESVCLAVMIVVQCRRRGGGFCLGLGSSGTEDVELVEKTSFASLVRLAKGLLDSGGREEGKAEVLFVWGAGGAAPREGADLWVCQEQGAHVVVQGTSIEEQRSFELCWRACAEDLDADAWQVPLVSPAALGLVQAWGKAPGNFAAARDAAGRLKPVPSLIHQRWDTAWEGRTAVVGDGFQISYKELRARAAAVAEAVQRHVDAGQSRAVLLCMGRGEATAPAFLGVLAAGCCAVPVDVHWPQDRVLQVASECGASLALTDPSSLHMVEGAPMKNLVLDRFFFEQAAKVGPKSEPAELSAEQAAIVIFTSGSSGKPKGIVMSHRYLTSLVLGIVESKRMNSATKTLCYHSPTWMPFLDNLFCPLVVGGSCLFFPDGADHVVKPAELSAFAQRHGATQAGFVPAMLEIFAEIGLPPTLSDVGVGGAAVPQKLCEHVLALLPSRADGSAPTLYTGYSGTEQGDVTQLQMRGAEHVQQGAGLSGFMTAGPLYTEQSVALLDAGSNLVGPGAVGEITVAGPGLATGYLNLPEKTAETFLPACAALEGAPAVRSGDLARWSQGGNLILVGRRDAMVKVRGARVELGEVEGTISGHPAVQACVVTVVDDKLVAYVAPAVPADLRDFCKARLVAYMVPHVFEGLEELPRLPNGKVNKKLLPKPQERADGAEEVMELDSLGQMRKFTRKAVSEDKVLDNVRAILIGLVLQSHSTPLNGWSPDMTSSMFHPLHAKWGPAQLFILQVARSGGWSSLAFLSGFDDTRAMRPFGLTYREPLFILLWLALDFNWTMWYLPVFAAMRAAFCAMHHLGLQKLHILLAAQIWISLPAFVDFYAGWRPGKHLEEMACPAQCLCVWKQWHWSEEVAHYAAGWWVENDNDPSRNSYVGHALIFIPCYWIGFYYGDRVFKVLTAIADEPSLTRRAKIAGASLAVYYVMFTLGNIVVDGFDDRCGAFWSPSGAFVWMQIAQNLTYYVFNLLGSLLWVVFIASAVPVHLKYLAKVCFASLLVSGLVPCLLDTPSQALELRKLMPASISPAVELSWTFFVPFLFELVVGAVVTTLLPILIKAGMRVAAKVKGDS